MLVIPGRTRPPPPPGECLAAAYPSRKHTHTHQQEERVGATPAHADDCERGRRPFQDTFQPTKQNGCQPNWPQSRAGAPRPASGPNLGDELLLLRSRASPVCPYIQSKMFTALTLSTETIIRANKRKRRPTEQITLSCRNKEDRFSQQLIQTYTATCLWAILP